MGVTMGRSLPKLETTIKKYGHYRHYKGGMYLTIDFFFCSDRDVWCVLYVNE